MPYPGIYRNRIPVRIFALSLALLLAILPGSILSQIKDTSPPFDGLKKLSLEELMNIEVTSVSKKSERLADAASAIQVITRQDIRNSGARTIPEALRLASNLQVAQVNSSQWAVSARGFNNVLANKLLVLINGRTVYTPLYAGVFWDVQNVLLDDVERIEVISGPGGTLWGANAVNGVINIITRSADETTGLFAEAGGGTFIPVFGSLRYGGRLAKDMHYRVYGTGFRMGNTVDTNGVKTPDEWSMVQGGFRVDWNASEKDHVLLEQNIYNGRPNPDANDIPIKARGSNMLARWSHTVSERSDYRLQAYYDHTFRDFRNDFTEDLKTADLEFQHRNRIGRAHELTYGLNVRMMDHKVTNLELFAFLPGYKKLYLYSLFVQDEISLIPDRLRLTIGGKIEHNTYTDFEYQPNGRLTWMPSKNQTIWSAVSRAVRTPSRIDRDFYLLLSPTLPFISGSDRFSSENVIAYELGWRSQLRANLSMSLSTFYNVYDNIRSVEPGPPPFNIPVIFDNGVEGRTYGVELATTYQVSGWWNLRGGYTFLNKDLSVKPWSGDSNEASAESNDPRHQFLLQSSMDITKNLQLGAVLRHTSALPDPSVPAYTGLSLRAGWKIRDLLEFNIVGQHLLKDRHLEFIPSSPSPRQIERNVYGAVTFRL